MKNSTDETHNRRHLHVAFGCLIHTIAISAFLAASTVQGAEVHDMVICNP